MNTLLSIDVRRLENLLDEGCSINDAIARTIGGKLLSDGMWRFYSHDWPRGRVTEWNSSGWRESWSQFLDPSAFFIGEDLFGNQLYVSGSNENVYLWNHENAESHDLLVDCRELVTTVFQHGLSWIDFYVNEYLEIMRTNQIGTLDRHLHWTTPLILGGAIHQNNLSIVEREPHLIGHAMLWKKIFNLPLGTEFTINNNK